MKSIESVDKTLSVLESFLKMGESVTLEDITKVVGMNKSTVNRILFTLVNRGYLKQSGKRGKYSLGTKCVDFYYSMKTRLKVGNIARPYLVQLSQIVQESVLLSIPEGKYTRHDELIPFNHVLNIGSVDGIKTPFYCNAVGKIFLAYMPHDEMDDYLNSVEMKRYTINTITHVNTLKNQLINIANEGIAFDDEEEFEGVRGIAAAIRDFEGKILAAVSVVGPSVRLTRSRMSEIAPEVKKCALNISFELGYKLPEISVS
jgi:IclR family transcriptional regulator, KDG regulon repressor